MHPGLLILDDLTGAVEWWTDLALRLRLQLRLHRGEKRVLNKAGGGVISCRKLEETAFRYEHGEPIYLNCSIMSWF